MTQHCHGALTRALMKLSITTALALGLTLVAVPVTTTGAQATTAPTAATQTQKLTRGERAVRLARSRHGQPYVYGAAGPNSFDCSGLTRWVYRKLGVRLPHSSSGQVSHTYRVKHPRRGDLVFFYDGGGVYHVAIYAGVQHGHRYVWHAPYPGSHVKKERIWTHSYFIRRVKRHG